MKKFFSAILCVILAAATVLAFSGCTKTQNLKYDVVLITDGNSINDGGYNESAWNGINEYAEKSGVKANYYQPKVDKEKKQVISTELVEPYVKLAVQKGAKFIVFPGTDYSVVTYELASSYPDVNFLLIDATPHSQDDKSVRLMNNVMSISFDELQSGYLAGYSAVLLGNTKLGYLGSVNSDTSSSYGAGFVQGAAAAADSKGIPVSVDYADYDSALLDYDYSFTVKAVYDKIENSSKECRKVVVENGFGTGTYQDGQNVSIYCDEYNEKGQKFDHWEAKSNTDGVKDKKVNLSSTKKTQMNLIVEKCDCTLTAVYKDTDDKTSKITVLDKDGNEYKTYIGKADSQLWVSAPAASKGYVFDHWTTSGAEDSLEDVNASSTNVTTTEKDVVLTPSYKISTDPTFDLTVEGGTGSGSYLAGDSVNVVANAPADGYYFQKWDNYDSDGNLTGIAMDNEFYYNTTFEMVDRYAAIAETMFDKGDTALFAGGNSKSDSLFTAKGSFDLSNINVIGYGTNQKDAQYSVVSEYGSAVKACLNDFKGASIYMADCSNKSITCNLPETDDKKADEVNKKEMDEVYSALADKKIKPIGVAPGADVRMSFSSKCLTLNYWIYNSAATK